MPRSLLNHYSVSLTSGFQHVHREQVGSVAGLFADDPPDHYPGAARVIWINGLPSVVMADAEICFRSDSVPGKLCDWISTILPAFVDRLQQDGANYEAIMQELLLAVKAEMPRLQLSHLWGPIAAEPQVFTFSCAIVWRDPATDSLKATCIGLGTDLIAIYRGQSGRYDIIKPALSAMIVNQIEIEAGDQLLALSQGAYRYLGHELDVQVLPAHLFSENKKKRREIVGDAMVGEGLVLARARVPSAANELQIQAHSLSALKAATVNVMQFYYPYCHRLFGRHHNQRRDAVCAAIQRAESYETLHAILLNQFNLSQGLEQQELSEAMLDPRWSQSAQNPFSPGSFYKRAIKEAYNNLQSEEREQDKPPLF